LSSAKVKRTPRVTAGPRPKGTWREKVHPFFIKAAEFNRKVVVLSRSDVAEEREEGTRLSNERMAELLKEAASLYDVMRPAGKIRHLGFLEALGIDDLPPGTHIPEPEYMFRWLCWFRFGKTLPTLTRQYNSGDRRAVKQMNKLRLELDMWAIGEVDPNKLKFKTDLDHFTLITSGLGMGFENLRPDELADCFDELCPCRKPHFSENLSKLRARILKDFPALPTEK
jgi:hypothetical protein